MRLFHDPHTRNDEDEEGQRGLNFTQRMTTDMDDENLIDPTVERDSPVLLHLEKIGEPVPGDEVACATCPAALWYSKGNDRLTCFCAMLHQTVFDGKVTDQQPVLFCDGREQALIKRDLQRTPQG